MPDKLNNDFGPPLLNQNNAPISTTSFVNGNIPIYWGPNQGMDADNIGRYLKPSGFKLWSPLRIPKICRFIYTAGFLDRYYGWAFSAECNYFVTVPNPGSAEFPPFFEKCTDEPYSYGEERPLAEYMTIWNSIRANLQNKYEDQTKSRYFYGQSYHKGPEIVESVEQFQPQCPVLSCAPVVGLDEEKWFGPSVLNILIISDAVGWKARPDLAIPGDPNIPLSFEWPPENWDDAILRIERYQRRWANYKLVIYVDKFTIAKFVNQLTGLGGTDARYMMDRTAEKLQEVCSSSYSWLEFGGILEDEIDATFFYPRINEFYGIEE